MTGSFTTPNGGVGFSIFTPPDAPPTPSVYRSQEGTGYPSCSRALARIPPNMNDANGYYETLGLQPWATDAEIKRALRSMMARAHPDHPDNQGVDEVTRELNLQVYMRLQEIAEVLLNPIHRANYNSIPKGRKLIDSQVKAEMEEAGIAGDDPGVQSFATTPEDYQGKTPKGAERPRDRFWDYLATNHDEFDLINAQEWYAHFLGVAPIFRYQATIKVLLHDGSGSAWKKEGGIMLIPRTWEPSSAMAFAMFRRHLGWPKLTPHEEPRVTTSWTQTYAGDGRGFFGGTTTLTPGHELPATRPSNVAEFLRPSQH